MGELLRVTINSSITAASPVIDNNNSATAANITAQQQYLTDTALNLLALIAATPFRRLLVPYFTRVAIFHSGLRAKLVSGGVLTAQVSSIFLSGMRDFDPILRQLDHFKQLSGRYVAVMEQALGASLSATALHEVTSRISATVDRCGVTQIANDLIEFILKQDNLRYELFAHFVGDDRFGERTSKLRKILSYLFKTASRQESAKFQALFEGALMKQELGRLDFTPQFSSCSWSYSPSSSPGQVCVRWAVRFVLSLTSMFETAQSVSRLEMLSIPQCHLAAERALVREFAALSSEQVQAIALALAGALNGLLDPTFEKEELPNKKIAAISRILNLQKVQSMPIATSPTHKFMFVPSTNNIL